MDTTPAVVTHDEQTNTNSPAHNYDHYRDTMQEHHDQNHNQHLKNLDFIHKNGIGRNGPLNSRAWWWIGGSVACTAIVVCLVCFVLPLVVFLIVFFKVIQEQDEMMEHSNEMMGGSSGPQAYSSHPNLFLDDGFD